jgi:hypothetical protein
MSRIFYVTLISLLLSGCPATFNGLVKNESTQNIVVVPPFETEFSWVIESGAEEKVNWYQECITIKGPNGIQYFSGWPIPDNVVTSGLFSSSLDAVYKNSELFFKNKEGHLIKISQVAKCEKA